MTSITNMPRTSLFNTNRDCPVIVNLGSSDYDLNIMRPSKWGNPFIIGRDGNRKEVCAKFDAYAEKHFSREEILSLKGLRLGCCCFPKQCHGQTLIRLYIKYSRG